MKTNYVKVKGKKGIIAHGDEVIIDRMEVLPPGIYEIYDQGGMFQDILTFEEVVLQESLVKFKTGVVGEILEKTEKFFSAESTASYKMLEIMQKMGILLYGPPGTGKTCTAQMAMTELVKNFDAVCLDATGKKLGFIKRMIEKVREVQPNPIVVFIDEAEKSLDHDEDGYLTFLDGTDSVNNFIFLGCTNYLDKVPRRLKERRSRIKYLFEVKALPLDVYKDYIRSKVKNMAETQVNKFAYLAEDAGLTIDELKHAVIDYVIENATIEKAIKTVKEYSKQEEW